MESTVERYLKRVTDEEVRSIIDVCSTLRSFDRDVLAAILSDQHVDKFFSKLLGHKHLIRINDNGSYHVPSYVRNYISKRFQMRSPSRWNEAQTKALAYYQHQLSDTSSNNWSHHAFNYLYHRLSLENDLNGLALFFPSEAKGSYKIDTFHPKDVSDILKIDYEIFGNGTKTIPLGDDVSEEQLNPDMTNRQTLLQLHEINPDMLRVVKDGVERVIGYSCVVPLTEQGCVEILDGKVLYYGLSLDSIERTPISENAYYYIDIVALLNPKDHRAGALLLRDFFARLNPSAKFIATLPNTDIGFDLMKRLGFERQDGIKIQTFSGERNLYLIDMDVKTSNSILAEALHKRQLF
jgi:hypothetical protein